MLFRISSFGVLLVVCTFGIIGCNSEPELIPCAPIVAKFTKAQMGPSAPSSLTQGGCLAIRTTKAQQLADENAFLTAQHELTQHKIDSATAAASEKGQTLSFDTDGNAKLELNAVAATTPSSAPGNEPTTTPTSATKEVTIEAAKPEVAAPTKN